MHEETGTLDIGAQEGARLLTAAAELVVGHLSTVADGPVAPAEPGTGQLRDWLAGHDFDRPAPAADTLAEVMGMLRQWGVHTTHPRYFGLFNPTPTWWGIAGEVLAAGVNPQLAAYSHAPAAVEMERHVLRFVAGRLGLPTAEGSFTVGGAEANLTAVIVALTRRFPAYPGSGLAGLARMPVLYASAESHLAWLKIAPLARQAGEWGVDFHVDAAWAGAVALERDVRLGELLARRLSEEGWPRVNDTPLPVVCVADPAAESQGPEHSAAWHAAVADHVVRSGQAWLSTVRLAGRPALRLCLTSHRTTVSDVEAAVTALNQARALN